MQQFKSFCLGLVMLVIVSVVLAACGDSSTPAPASSGSSQTSLKINGTNLVTLDPALNSVVKKAFVSSLSKEAVNIADLNFTMYASDSPVAKLAEDTDTAISGAGYKYADPSDPNATKMTASGSSVTGFYTKANAPDLIPAIADATSYSKVPASLPAGVDAAAYQKFVDQFKGKKSALILISGTGILDSVKKSRPTTEATTTTTVAATTAPVTTAVATTSASVTTVAATTSVPTKAATTTAATTSAPASVPTAALSLPAIDGANEIKLNEAMETGIVNSFKTSAPAVNDLVFKVFGSDDEAQDLADSTDAALTGAGYKFSLPGQTKPFKQNDLLLAGFYGKPNAPDLFIMIGDPGKGLGASGLDSKTLLVMSPDLKDKSAVLILVAGTGLTKALVGGAASSPTTTVASASGSATPAATTGGSLGKELIGVVYDNGLGVKDVITKVEVRNEIDVPGGGGKPKGVWLIVFTDVENSTDHVTLPFFDLIDAAGNVYSASSAPLLALNSDPKYNDDITPIGIPAGGKGKGIQVYDVPANATGLKPNS